MSEELKPCPFCGGEPEIFEGISGSVMYMPICKDSSCIAGDDGYYGKSKEEAIKAWNTRTLNQ